MITQPEVRRIVHKKMRIRRPYPIDQIYEMVIDEYDFHNDNGDMRVVEDRIRGFLAQEKRNGRMDNPKRGVWIRTAENGATIGGLQRRVSKLEKTMESLRKALVK